MKLGQQVDDHLAFAPGKILGTWPATCGKDTRDGVTTTIVGSGHREQCADSCRQAGNENSLVAFP
jgi:hypothetical protein